MRLVPFVLALLAGFAAAETYHVSPEGDDNNDGTAPYRAWRSLDRVNRQHLKPGDTVFLESGAVFDGPLLLDKHDSGEPGAPVTVATNGERPAVVSVMVGDGVHAVNAAHIHLRNLSVRGPGGGNSAGGHGVLFETADENGARVPGVRLQGLDVSGFYWNGVFFSSGHASNPGFDGTAIADCTVYENGLNGIEFSGRFLAGGAPRYAHRGIVVRDCRVFGNRGRAGFPAPSGSGISLGFVDEGEVVHCQTYANGGLSDATTGGPAGIRVWQSRRIAVRRCESGANETAARGGAGIALDGGTAECLVEYNFAHGNAGPGFALSQFPYAHPARDNTIRYNIAQTNGRREGAGIQIDAAPGNAGVFGTVIAHNAVYVGPSQNGPAFAYTAAAPGAAGARRTALVNNIFATVARKNVLEIAAGAEAWDVRSNIHHTVGHPPRLIWEDTPYDDIGAWRIAAGLTGEPDRAADPLLRAPGFAPGLESPHALAGITAYDLLPGSPAIDQAAPMAYPGPHPPPAEDFAGRPRLAGAGVDIGPLERHRPADMNCFDIAYETLAFKTFAAVLSGSPPATLFFYPGYYDYPTGGPGDPAVQDGDGNGVYDAYDFALLAKAVCMDERIRAHYDAAVAFHAAIWRIDGADYSFGAVYGIAAMDTLSDGARAIVQWTSNNRYGPYKDESAAVPEVLAAEGDFDGDGLSNLEEFRRTIENGGGPEVYAEAAANK